MYFFVLIYPKGENRMSWMRAVFLLTVILVASGYRFRCWWMCQDQTAIQNDYIEQRDRCRDYAQLKLDLSLRNSGDMDNEQSRKARIIALFGECMANNGWSMTSTTGLDKLGGGGQQAQHAGPKQLQPGQARQDPTTAATAGDDRAAISRSAECAFARQAASVSSIAAARAKACDLECAQRLRLAPDAPRPAACPSGPTPSLATGGEHAVPH